LSLNIDSNAVLNAYGYAPQAGQDVALPSNQPDVAKDATPASEPVTATSRVYKPLFDQAAIDSGQLASIHRQIAALNAFASAYGAAEPAEPGTVVDLRA